MAPQALASDATHRHSRTISSPLAHRLLTFYLVIGVREVISSSTAFRMAARLISICLTNAFAMAPIMPGLTRKTISNCLLSRVFLRSFSFVSWHSDCGCVPSSALRFKSSRTCCDPRLANAWSHVTFGVAELQYPIRSLMHKDELTVAQVGDMIAPLGFLLERSYPKEPLLVLRSIFSGGSRASSPSGSVKSIVRPF